MNLHEPFYAALTSMLDVNRQGAAIDYGMVASDYVEHLRAQADRPADSELDLLNSVLARSIEIAIRYGENYDNFVCLLSKRHPEQYIYSLIAVLLVPIPQLENAYRQILFSIDNLFYQRQFIEPPSPLYNTLLGMINVRDIATNYRVFLRYDSELLDRVIDLASLLETTGVSRPA